MFSLCEAMKWAHLPAAGGIYDQHPRLLEGFRIIFSKRGIKEAKRREDQERKDRYEKAHSSRVAGRRR